MHPVRAHAPASIGSQTAILSLLTANFPFFVRQKQTLFPRQEPAEKIARRPSVWSSENLQKHRRNPSPPLALECPLSTHYGHSADVVSRGR